ncbi:MAG: glycosyltransferase family 2 protein, partial [Bdellovibrionia bacterium]
MKTTVLVPVFSETEALAETTHRLQACLGRLEYEILLVASPRSEARCLRECVRLEKSDPRIQLILQSQRPGQGWAFREAANLATGTHLVFMCSDLETLPETAAELVRASRESSADVIVASRWHRDSRFEGYGAFKLALNWIFQSVVRRFFRTPISDLTYV